jgi:hypothetical protein
VTVLHTLFLEVCNCDGDLRSQRGKPRVGVCRTVEYVDRHRLAARAGEPARMLDRKRLRRPVSLQVRSLIGPEGGSDRPALLSLVPGFRARAHPHFVSTDGGPTPRPAVSHRRASVPGEIASIENRFANAEARTSAGRLTADVRIVVQDDVQQ